MDTYGYLWKYEWRRVRGPIGIRIAWGKNQGRMVGTILPSYVIFHFAALDFEHKVEKIAPRLLREK